MAAAKKEAKEEKEKIDWMTLMTEGDGTRTKQCSTIPPRRRLKLATPSLTWALSGGLVPGNTTCAYGPEGGGKSLISMLAVGELHQSDPTAIAVLNTSEMRDVDPRRVAVLGVDPSRLLIRKYNTIHDIFDWSASPDRFFETSDGDKKKPGLLYLLRQGAPIKMMITDSIKGIRGPKEQKLATAEKENMGDLSKFLNQAQRLMLPTIKDFELYNFFVQQVNMNMDPDEVKYLNKKYILPSGMSLRHFCETMMLVERVEYASYKQFDTEKANVRDQAALQTGHTIRVKVEKANLDTPFREAEFHIDYQRGVVDTGLEVFKLGKNLGVIKHPLVEDDKTPGKMKVAENRWVFGDREWVTNQQGGAADKCTEDLESDPALRKQVMEAIGA